MRVYSYDPDTFVFLSTTVADPSPMEPGGYLMPAFTTHVPPPSLGPREVAVFVPASDAWEVRQLADPGVSAEPMTIGLKVEGLRKAVVAYANSVAVSFGYDSLDEAVTYADEPAVPQYQAEGRAFRAWRSLLWFAFEDMAKKVNLYQAVPPASDEALFEALPQFTPPEV